MEVPVHTLEDTKHGSDGLGGKRILRKRQRTFDDFKNVKTVLQPSKTSKHTIPLREKLEDEGKSVADANAKKAKSNSKNKSPKSTKSAFQSGSSGDNNIQTKLAVTTENPDYKFSISLKPDYEDQNLIVSNWTPNSPLEMSDFASSYNDTEICSLMKKKPVIYAGDVFKIMSFINKFYTSFSPELLSLAFQDFEVGLDLYPIDYVEDTSKQRVLYQDYMASKDLIEAQDKMNLLFLTLLKLLFNPLKTDNQPHLHRPYASMANLNSKEAYVKLVRSLRQNARGWGLPKEWRVHQDSNLQSTFVNSDGLPFSPDDSEIQEEILDSNDMPSSDILNSEGYQDQLYYLESVPLYKPELGKFGISSLQPEDRIILLRAMVDWCTSNSTKIRNEIHRLSHFKKDPSFGIHTQHVSRLMLEGFDLTTAQFLKLCSLFDIRYARKDKRRNAKKPLTEEKKEELDRKLLILKDINAIVKDSSVEGKEKTILSLYDRWMELFEGDIVDNPLSNPYQDEVYRLRSQEFFIGRIPYVGDLYIPLLASYFEADNIGSTYKDLRSIQKMFRKFEQENMDSTTILKHMDQLDSLDLRVFFFDIFSAVHDTMNNATEDKIYWYEVSNDTKTLKDFLKNLDKQITSLEEDIKSGSKPTKEYKFDMMRDRMRVLHYYLMGIYNIHEKLEKIKCEYADIQISSRTLRRSQRRGISYKNVAQDGDSDYDADMDVEKDEDVSKTYVDEVNNTEPDYLDDGFDDYYDEQADVVTTKQRSESREDRLRRRLGNKKR